jgi:hypothetical protein
MMISSFVFAPSSAWSRQQTFAYNTPPLVAIVSSRNYSYLLILVSFWFPLGTHSQPCGVLLFKDCIVIFDPQSNCCLTGAFSGDFISLTGSMTNAALSGVRMLNFGHIVLVALIIVEDGLKLAPMLGVTEVMALLGIKGVVPPSLQHSFSRRANSCLCSSIFNR